MYCSKCGNKLDPNNKFCSSCGTAIVTTNAVDNVNTTNNTNVVPVNKSKKKIDINKILIILIISVVSITVLGLGYSLYDNTRTRTIMIYMVGADLESRSGLATSDIEGLNYSKINSNNTRIIIMAGGSNKWNNDYISSNETSIYELRETGFVKVDRRKLDNMGQKDNLKYLLDYAYNNYKASKYNLIFWDHGGAVDGSEYDQILNDHLTPVEMREAFEESSFKNKKLDTISFRTCLNATIEVANALKDHADYLIASEEVTIGHTVASALEFINDIKASDNGIEYGTKQIEGYKSSVRTICKKSYQFDEYCVNTTYSIIDLSRINNLNKEVDKFANDLVSSLNSNYNEMAKIRSNLSQYGSDEPAYDMIDLHDFVTKYSKFSNSSSNVIKELEKTIIHSFSNNDYSHGLSIYFPYNDKVFLKDYADIAVSSNYNSYINKFLNIKDNKKITSFNTFNTAKGNMEKESKEKANFEINLTPEQKENFASAKYLVFINIEDEPGYYSLVYVGKNTKLDGNTLKAKVEGKVLRASDSEYEDVSTYIRLYEEEVTDEYVDVTTMPLLVRGLFANRDLVTMKIRIDKDHPEGRIISIINNSKEKSDSNEFSLFSNTSVSMKDYNGIQFVYQGYKIFKEDGKFNENFFDDGNGIYQGMEFSTDMFKFVREDFDSDNDYYATFLIQDVSGKSYYSDIVKMK